MIFKLLCTITTISKKGGLLLKRMKQISLAQQRYAYKFKEKIKFWLIAIAYYTLEKLYNDAININL